LNDRWDEIFIPIESYSQCVCRNKMADQREVNFHTLRETPLFSCQRRFSKKVWFSMAFLFSDASIQCISVYVFGVNTYMIMKSSLNPVLCFIWMMLCVVTIYYTEPVDKALIYFCFMDFLSDLTT
jgi:hypothetical protein